MKKSQRTKTFVIGGKKFRVKPSKRKNKQLVAVFSDGKEIHFGDPDMPEYPGTKRGDNYCARSSGIKGVNNPKSANFWSRQMWSCKEKKSTSKKKFFGRLN